MVMLILWCLPVRVAALPTSAIPLSCLLWWWCAAVWSVRVKSGATPLSLLVRLGWVSFSGGRCCWPFFCGDAEVSAIPTRRPTDPVMVTAGRPLLFPEDR